jgi:hypothetical protein
VEIDNELVKIQVVCFLLISSVFCHVIFFQFYDTSGRKEYNYITMHYIRDISVHSFLILYDTSYRVRAAHPRLRHFPLNPAQHSFEKASDLVKTVRLLNKRAGCNVVLVGCKVDIDAEQRKVTREEGQHLADEMQCHFFEASAKSSINVTETFMKAVHIGLHLQKQISLFSIRRGETDFCYQEHPLQKLTFFDLPEHDCRCCSVCRAVIANGSVGAQCQLCQFFLCSRCAPAVPGVARNLEKVISEVRLEALKGDAAAQFDLAMCLFNGEGVVSNHAEAAAMLQLAADQGHACAQFMLGKCLLEGKGIHKCDSKALFWFGCAAKQKFSPAENKLKVMDVTELHLAAARGDEDSVKRLLLMDEDIHSTDQCVKAAHNGLLSHFISCGFNN